MSVNSSAAASAPVHNRATWGWAVRRALLGVFILSVGVALAATLLYLAIDRDAEARAESDGLRKTAVVRDAGR